MESHSGWTVALNLAPYNIFYLSIFYPIRSYQNRVTFGENVEVKLTFFPATLSVTFGYDRN